MSRTVVPPVRVLCVASIAVAIGTACAKPATDDAYFPPTVIPATARRVSALVPCLPHPQNATDLRMLITGAGIGLPIPSDFSEVPQSYERGVLPENHRAWIAPASVARVSYRVYAVADLRRDGAADSLTSGAQDVRSCDATVDGHRVHVVSSRLPAGVVRPGEADEVRAWLPTGDGHMVSIYALGEPGFRDTMLPLLSSMRIGLPPSHENFPHETPPVASTRSPDSVPLGDAVAWRGHFALAGGTDTVFRIALYDTQVADVVHLERFGGDSGTVVARLRLPDGVRVDSLTATYTVCKVNGVADPEVFGFYQRGTVDTSGARPSLAWRANRTALRFEPVPAETVSCEPEDDGGDDGPPG